MQQQPKHVSAPTNQHATIEELLESEHATTEELWENSGRSCTTPRVARPQNIVISPTNVMIEFVIYIFLCIKMLFHYWF
jgi:hypothetical protein